MEVDEAFVVMAEADVRALVTAEAVALATLVLFDGQVAAVGTTML